jgi:hypothetical protein
VSQADLISVQPRLQPSSARLQRSQMFIEPGGDHDPRSSGAQRFPATVRKSRLVSLRWSEEDLLELAVL